MEVRKLIRRPPATIRPTTTLREAARTLVEENVGALLVVQGGYLVGIITERDIVSSVADDESGRELDEAVDGFMAEEPYHVSSTTSVGEAARVMTEKGIRHLPIVDGNDLHGIISMRDLLFAALEETAAEARADWTDYLVPDILSSPADGG